MSVEQFNDQAVAFSDFGDRLSHLAAAVLRESIRHSGSSASRRRFRLAPELLADLDQLASAIAEFRRQFPDDSRRSSDPPR